jgi:hypothetical protein
LRAQSLDRDHGAFDGARGSGGAALRIAGERMSNTIFDQAGLLEVSEAPRD